MSCPSSRRSPSVIPYIASKTMRRVLRAPAPILDAERARAQSWQSSVGTHVPSSQCWL
jgi:hypothetical protein